VNYKFVSGAIFGRTVKASFMGYWYVYNGCVPTVNPLLSPLSPISPPPSNKPPFKGKKVLITQDCKISFGLIWDDLLTFGSSDLFFMLSCLTSDFLYLSFFTLHSSSLWRTDTTIFAKLNTPSLPNNPPPPPPPHV